VNISKYDNSMNAMYSSTLDKYVKNLQVRDSMTELISQLAGYLISQSSSNKLYNASTNWACTINFGKS